jgi:hypothetical protein
LLHLPTLRRRLHVATKKAREKCCRCNSWPPVPILAAGQAYLFSVETNSSLIVFNNLTLVNLPKYGS